MANAVKAVARRVHPATDHVPEPGEVGRREAKGASPEKVRVLRTFEIPAEGEVAKPARPRRDGLPIGADGLTWKERQTKLKRERYWEKKAAGTCVRDSCHETAGDTNHCERHKLSYESYRRKRTAKCTAKSKKWTWKRRRRRNYEGKCALCTGERAIRNNGKLARHCEECLAKVRARSAAKRRAKGIPERDIKCPHCGGKGHYFWTCDAERPPIEDQEKLTIDELATSRREWN